MTVQWVYLHKIPNVKPYLLFFFYFVSFVFLKQNNNNQNNIIININNNNIYRKGNLKIHSTPSMNDARMIEKFVLVIREQDMKNLKKIISKKLINLDEIYRFEAGLEKMTALHYCAKEGYIQVINVRNMVK